MFHLLENGDGSANTKLFRCTLALPLKIFRIQVLLDIELQKLPTYSSVVPFNIQTSMSVQWMPRMAYLGHCALLVGPSAFQQFKPHGTKMKIENNAFCACSSGCMLAEMKKLTYKLYTNAAWSIEKAATCNSIWYDTVRRRRHEPLAGSDLLCKSTIEVRELKRREKIAGGSFLALLDKHLCLTGIDVVL
ncbi:hypothetical protein SADUNF_Sadunf10G0126800 [Salix dunnii]|uniref:Uncharacterized protein n=1 Tax=Salix dunnii TaxID=1413687 RepID=A0A835MS17_9ROSI|nr:hypothetical protein SADUNF_Sadunf10G0126800 [Salix dunnii]